MTETFTTFGEMLKHLRQRAQLTQDELGLAVGYSRAHIARLESNQRTPDVSAVQARFFEPLDLKADSEDAALLVKLAQSAHATPSHIANEAAPSQSIPNNLPYELTSFIGREAVLNELERLLPTTRLLTLTGTGGTGKTRLALKLAERVMADYPDGAWLVELAALSDPAMVPQAILAALGRPDVPAQQAAQTLINWLKAKRIFLLIDNCEHVIDACAQAIDALLRGCRNLTVLATSREALGIPGEQSWRVPSLQVPDAKSPLTLEAVSQYESVRLFVERAAFVQPAFALNADNAPAVLRVCKRLDGIPLAIELAAARIASFSPETIAKRLDGSFRLLAGGSRIALPRQQTLQAAIEWSYRLLNEQEKSLLCRLSVFAGGWTLEAGEFVGQGDGIEKDQIFDLLDKLVGKSLVERDDSGVETRYFLLESIRQFALGKLAEHDQVAAVRDRHLEYFLRLGEGARKGLEASVPVNQARLILRLKPDLDNIRRACEWALDSEKIEAGWSLLESFFGMFVVCNMQMEYIDRMHVMLTHAAAPQNTPRQARLFYLLGEIQNRHGKFEDELATMMKISEIGHALDDNEILAWSETGLFANAIAQGHLEDAHWHFKKWNELASRIVDFMTERDGGNLGMQCALLFMAGDYQQACNLQKEIYDRAGHSDNKLSTSAIERAYGIKLLYAGHLDQADEHLRVSLIDNHALGDSLAVAACLGSFAALALARNDLPRCAKLLGASETQQELVGVVFHWFDLSIIDRTVNRLREQIDGDDIHKYWTEGRAMTLAQAMAFALETA